MEYESAGLAVANHPAYGMVIFQLVSRGFIFSWFFDWETRVLHFAGVFPIKWCKLGAPQRAQI